MTSKIINMAERIMDDEDRLLESMFAAEPLQDSGFSEAIVRKVQRKLWLRRLILPVAASVGGVVAFEPMVALVGGLRRLSAMIPTEIIAVGDSSIPQLPLLVLGGMLFVGVMVGTRVLDE